MKPIIVRGGGDLATATIHRLCKSGYPVIILECERPSAIRRLVSFCQAVYEETMEVEGLTCSRAESFEEALGRVSWNRPQLIVDPQRNSGTYLFMISSVSFTRSASISLNSGIVLPLT